MAAIHNAIENILRIAGVSVLARCHVRQDAPTKKRTVRKAAVVICTKRHGNDELKQFLSSPEVDYTILDTIPEA